MPARCALLDLDGTLIDTNALHADAFAEALEQFGYKIPPGRIRREIGKGGPVAAKALVGDVPEADDIATAQGKSFDRLARERGIDLLPGAVELVKALKDRGLVTVLATSSGQGRLDVVKELTGVDFAELCDAHTTGGDADHGKPAGELPRAAAKRVGLHPGQCFMVGDSPHDAHAARRAGMTVLAVAGGGYDPDGLRAAGVRGVWDTPAALADDLDAALAAADPKPIDLDQAAIDKLIDAALQVARDALADGGAPIGATLHRPDGGLVHASFNQQHRTDGLIDHAEIMCFREAAAKLSRDDKDLILVCTLEPCVMCTGAAMVAGCDTVIYGLEAPSNGGVARVQPTVGPGERTPRVIGGARRDACRDLFQKWLDAQDEGGQGQAFVKQLLADTSEGA